MNSPKLNLPPIKIPPVDSETEHPLSTLATDRSFETVKTKQIFRVDITKRVKWFDLNMKNKNLTYAKNDFVYNNIMDTFDWQMYVPLAETIFRCVL